MGTTRVYRDVGYARLSMSDPDEAGAIARQKQDIERLSARTGGELIGPILVDNAISASRYARRKRKDYPKLLEMARAGLADRAVIYDVDRLLRIPRELEDLIDLVEELNGRFTVVGVNGVMDLSTADGRFFARMRVAQAAKESDDLSRRVLRMHEQRAEQGKPWGRTGRNRMFGWLDGGEEHDPIEAELIRQAAEDVVNGASLNGIARRWNEAGVRGPRDAQWTQLQVRRVLSLPRNAGLHTWHGEVMGPSSHPGIIDADTYGRLCRMLDDRRREPRRRSPFTGLFTSPDGRRMVRSLGQRGIRSYRTVRPHPGVAERLPSVSISPAEQLEELTLELLFADVEQGGTASRAAARRRAAPRPLGEDPKAVRRELVELAEDKAERRITRDEWLAMRRPLERRLAAAEAAQAAADQFVVVEHVDPDVRERWWLPVDEGGWDDDQKRRTLFAVFERVEVLPAERLGPGFDPDRVTAVYR